MYAVVARGFEPDGDGTVVGPFGGVAPRPAFDHDGWAVDGGFWCDVVEGFGPCGHWFVGGDDWVAWVEDDDGWQECEVQGEDGQLKALPGRKGYRPGSLWAAPLWLPLFGP